MAVELHVFLGNTQRLAARHAQLQFDEVETGNHFGDGMLDLQARVHLEEIERAALIEQELHGAGADIADCARGLDRCGAHSFAQVGRHDGAGRFLDHLLVASLHRTVALAEMDDCAVVVGEHLDFDMARPNDGLLEDQVAIAECILCLGAR